MYEPNSAVCRAADHSGHVHPAASEYSRAVHLLPHGFRSGVSQRHRVLYCAWTLE
jgi:hypothetical protein